MKRCHLHAVSICRTEPRGPETRCHFHARAGLRCSNRVGQIIVASATSQNQQQRIHSLVALAPAACEHGQPSRLRSLQCTVARPPSTQARCISHRLRKIAKQLFSDLRRRVLSMLLRRRRTALSSDRGSGCYQCRLETGKLRVHCSWGAVKAQEELRYNPRGGRPSRRRKALWSPVKVRTAQKSRCCRRNLLDPWLLVRKSEASRLPGMKKPARCHKIFA